MKYFKSALCALFVLLISSINFIVFAGGDDVPDCYAKIVLVGNFCCGKTSVQKMLFGDPFDPCEGASDMMSLRTVSRDLNDGRSVQFNIWDTAGADKYYDQVIKFLKGANFVVIVHDLSAEYTTKTEEYLEKLLIDINNQMNSDGKIIIVGSKYDLRNRKPLNFSKHKSLLDNLNHAHNYHVYYSSANDRQLAPQIRAKLLSYIKDKCETMKLHSKNPDDKFFRKFDDHDSGKGRITFSITSCVIL